MPPPYLRMCCRYSCAIGWGFASVQLQSTTFCPEDESFSVLLVHLSLWLRASRMYSLWASVGLYLRTLFGHKITDFGNRIVHTFRAASGSTGCLRGHIS